MIWWMRLATCVSLVNGTGVKGCGEKMIGIRLVVQLIERHKPS
jgi:hypothetical protein